MKYEFNLNDYDDIMDEINERLESKGKEFEKIKIAENSGSELYVYGYRVFIPELNLTAREGMEYDEDDQGIDCYILYDGDEKDPLKFNDCYCNSYLIDIITEYAYEKNGNTNPKCVIDDEEFAYCGEND